MMNDPLIKAQMQQALRDAMLEILAKGTEGKQKKGGGGGKEGGGGGGGKEGGGGGGGGGS